MSLMRQRCLPMIRQYPSTSRWSLRNVGGLLSSRIGPATLSPSQPEPPAFGLFAGNLEPLTPPDALDPLVVDQPAGPAQQRRDLAIAVADSATDLLGNPPAYRRMMRHRSDSDRATRWRRTCRSR
jgi:hypothetical protein